MTRPAALFLLLGLAALADGTAEVPVDVKTPDAHTLIGEQNFLSDYTAVNEDGSVNVVVEIPAGTDAKWEVDKRDGALRWEIKDGKPRIVRYLGYPGNYGMIPRTLLPAEQGGDGDPLDVIVLGPATPRGEVVRVRLLGVLKMLDDGETDDKLIAVQEGTPLADATDLADLDRRFPGVTRIVETWFANYKGAGRIETRGYGDRDAANHVLREAMKAFEMPVERAAPSARSR